MSFVKTYPAMKEQGARYVTLMYQDSGRRPADIATLDRWIKAYNCNYDVLTDPKASIRPPSGSIGLPYHIIVNPRDMKVFATIAGAGPSVEAAVKQVIALNSK